MPCSKTERQYENKPRGSRSNLLAVLEGKTPTENMMDIVVPTEYGKLMLAEFDYDNKPK
jgi:sulfide:quinone oxidoreductase